MASNYLRFTHRSHNIGVKSVVAFVDVPSVANDYYPRCREACHPVGDGTSERFVKGHGNSQNEVRIGCIFFSQVTFESTTFKSIWIL